MMLFEWSKWIIIVFGRSRNSYFRAMGVKIVFGRGVESASTRPSWTLDPKAKVIGIHFTPLDVIVAVNYRVHYLRVVPPGKPN